MAVVKQVTKNRGSVKTKSSKPKTTAKKKDSRLPQMAKPMKGKRKHPQFGTSKAEQDFAKQILDKLGVEYVWQFEAKEIGRFFDYYLPKQRILIEYDGDYYHSHGLVREQMNPMQKRNYRVDREKDAWAALHGIPLIRIWEHEAKNNPQGVLQMLKERLYIRDGEIKKKEEKNKRHVNQLDK